MMSGVTTWTKPAARSAADRAASSSSSRGARRRVTQLAQVRAPGAA